MPKPAFLITIDTEGDDAWSGSSRITTRNATFLPRFQILCERFGLKPTYLTNYEMATSPEFVAFAKEALARDTAEVGMHLHAWNSPPLIPLTPDDHKNATYLIEYPKKIVREKVAVMTKLLEDTFGRKMLSHRAGRWVFNEYYAELLMEFGYTVDCSVTPYVSWRHFKGDPKGQGGTDYRHFPRQAYFLDPKNIRKKGKSSLLELPVTVMPRYPMTTRMLPGALWKSQFLGKAANRLANDWLRAKPGDLPAMLRVVQKAREQKLPYIEFMMHSSEFMPGGSPYFKDEAAIETLYRDLEVLFTEIKKDFEGKTLAEYRATFTA